MTTTWLCLLPFGSVTTTFTAVFGTKLPPRNTTLSPIETTDGPDREGPAWAAKGKNSAIAGRNKAHSCFRSFIGFSLIVLGAYRRRLSTVYAKREISNK